MYRRKTRSVTLANQLYEALQKNDNYGIRIEHRDIGKDAYYQSEVEDQMSVSGKVKEELLEHYARARHCDIAELAAIVHMAGIIKVGHGGVCCLKVHTENRSCEKMLYITGKNV